MPRLVLLAGPHGSGKTVLGERAAASLGLRFADVGSGDPDDQRAQLAETVSNGTADVIALSVELQELPETFTLARRAGVLIGLRAHPLELQARSGRLDPSR